MARKKSGASAAPETKTASPPRGEVQSAGESPLFVDLPATQQTLAALQRRRLFSIVQQSRSNRALESYIAPYLGYDPGASEKDRKGTFLRAKAVIEAVAEGRESELGGEIDASLEPIVRATIISRAPWDGIRHEAEKEMRRLALTVPAAVWAVVPKGMGDLGLARFLAEVTGVRGGLETYETKERVWKRCGLAVIGGVRQQKRTNKEEAAAHGYRPRRRAEIWDIADKVFRQQGTPDAGTATRWRLVYDDRRAHTLPRMAATEDLPPSHKDKWTRQRCRSDAVRIMMKAIIEEVWKTWRQANHDAQTMARAPAASPSKDEQEIGASGRTAATQESPRRRRASEEAPATGLAPSGAPFH